MRLQLGVSKRPQLEVSEANGVVRFLIRGDSHVSAGPTLAALRKGQPDPPEESLWTSAQERPPAAPSPSGLWAVSKHLAGERQIFVTVYVYMHCGRSVWWFVCIFFLSFKILIYLFK